MKRLQSFKRRLSRPALIAAALLIAAGSVTAAELPKSPEVTETGKLTLANTLEYAPFEFTGEDGKPTGVNIELAAEAARLLAAEGFRFDVAFTSVLKRAIRTLWIVMEGMDRMWIPVRCSWQLNERHYGALQGLNKADTAARYGAEQVEIWRRSFDVAPPPVDPDDERHPSRDPRYAGHVPEDLPASEALRDTLARVESYWRQCIVPCLRDDKTVLIVAHGNSLRALVKYLDHISEEQIVGLNIPTGIPLVYEFDEDLRPTTHYYLGDSRAVAGATRAVADQLKKKGP